MAKKKKAKSTARTAKKRPARRSAKTPVRARKASHGLQLSSIAASLTVNDLEQSLSWYSEVLGFTVRKRWEHEGKFVGAELQAGPVDVYISQDDWQKGRDRVKGDGFRIYWYTDQDIDQIAAGIKARGGTLASEPKDEWGVRSFHLIDPTGYKITISSNR